MKVGDKNSLGMLTKFLLLLLWLGVIEWDLDSNSWAVDFKNELLSKGMKNPTMKTELFLNILGTFLQSGDGGDVTSTAIKFWLISKRWISLLEQSLLYLFMSAVWKVEGCKQWYDLNYWVPAFMKEKLLIFIKHWWCIFIIGCEPSLLLIPREDSWSGKNYTLNGYYTYCRDLQP